jgi:septum formation protein
MKLVLASTSPRRTALLDEAGFRYEVRPHSAVEGRTGDPYIIVVANALEKARSAVKGPGEVIMGFDTLVVCNGEVLGKPGDREDARRMLILQLQYPQEVVTGVAVIDPDRGREFTGYEISRVVMKGSEKVLDDYLGSELWKGKAGAYGIQDRGPLLPELLMGNEDNVVGLPMILLKRLLALVGFNYPERTPSGE